MLDETAVRYFDSDRISLVTNLARCTFEQKEELRELVARHLTSTADKKKFNEKRTVRRLLHFVRSEKPAFEAEIEPDQLAGVYLVKPKLNNRRLLAQEGAFLAFGLTSEIAKAGIEDIEVNTIDVSPGRQAAIRTQLSGLSINERTLFPEIERAARYLTDELGTTGLLARATAPAASPEKRR